MPHATCRRFKSIEMDGNISQTRLRTSSLASLALHCGGGVLVDSYTPAIYFGGGISYLKEKRNSFHAVK